LSDYIKWRALADVVVVGLIVGAGLPALFALGVRALAGPGSRDEAGRRPAIRVVAAIACFAVVLAAIATAIVIIGTGGH
jgi:hypothetical protein